MKGHKSWPRLDTQARDGPTRWGERAGLVVKVLIGRILWNAYEAGSYPNQCDV